jgi:hypothetical protein
VTSIFDDLATYALFGGGKVRVVVDPVLLVGKGLVAELVAEARESAGGAAAVGALAGDQRTGALALLRALRLQGIDPLEGPPDAVIELLPKEAFGRKSKGLAEAKAELAALLAAARRDGLVGWGDEAVERLATLVSSGLPRGHHLVLVERAVEAENPVVQTLDRLGAVVRLATVGAGRDGAWSGVNELAAELEQQTGAGIDHEALQELARRTLRTPGQRGQAGADVDSTARFAGEYRKLAGLSGGRAISRELVARTVADRGEEDVWKILDAVAEGRPAEAIGRLRRRLDTAEDRVGERLAIFSLLGSFCRQLVAIRGATDLLGLRPERNYNRFKDSVAPKLQGPLPGVGENPLAGLHPFRLHRATQAALGLDRVAAARLPGKLLDTELALKGESGEPEIALVAFLADLCQLIRPQVAGGGSARSR